MSAAQLERIANVLEAIEERTHPRPEPYRNPHNRDSRYDNLGRKVPARFSLALALRAVPGLAARLRRVPGYAVAETGEDEHGDFALLNCPCGQRPIARSTFEKCGGCERWYSLVEEKPFVLYGDMEPPIAPGADRGQP